MEVKAIVETWLKDNGYDGLYQEDAECACLIGDLRPCDEDMSRCKAGYKHADPNNPIDWIVGGTKTPPCAACGCFHAPNGNTLCEE